ncbi:ATP-dependent RNA helicase [Tieghemiomyces parasiticus]|uniref:ATP-dependent RNA helicase n=1 Tax=Tieghemiomyces parasiticus TaxID=78921 RepID=A0A9W8ALT9_9FUNG|nr:ATP-dependent RNA helicase [Tieghemiomyces parasiticus]
MWEVTDLNAAASGHAATQASKAKRALPSAISKRNKKRKQGIRVKSPASAETAEVLGGNMDDWGWSEVKCPESMLVSDSMSGFLCLEELDGVDCEIQGDEKIGKSIRFKRKGSTKSATTAKKANPKAPLSLEETRKFISVDDFEEDAEYAPNPEADSEAANGETGSEPVPSKRPGESISSTGPQITDIESPFEADVESTPPPRRATDTQLVTTAEPHNSDGDQAKEVAEPVDSIPDCDTSAWEALGVSAPLLKALGAQGFSEPTEIQALTLTPALQGRDVVGAAETGSGKTVAFGLPMLEHYVQHRSADQSVLLGLILTPTRELAVQVNEHLTRLARFTGASIATVVGGMSVQKQRRILARHPDFIVATPGRLWELVTEDPTLENRLRNVKFLAIDEADRLLEPGHFAEVANILRLVNGKEVTTMTNYDADGNLVESSSATKGKGKQGVRRQTFVFSATLTKELRFRHTKQSPLDEKASKGQSEPTRGPPALQDLLDRVDFRDAKPCIVDVTQADGMARRLVEAKINCMTLDKDFYLFYFIKRYPGRTLVFVNSIDAIRRLLPILQLLQVPAYGLHSHMQQRARLKNVDRFKANHRAVLVASDVAARGLDIPLVEHVIHYQVPRAADIYIHRSGRTARGKTDGLSLMMLSPEEMRTYKKLCTLLKKDDIDDFPVELGVLTGIRERVSLARKINGADHKYKKEQFEEDWFRRGAEEIGLELDADFHHQGGKVDEDDEDEWYAEGSTRKGKKAQRQRDHASGSNGPSNRQITAWKKELELLLVKPILPRGASSKFLTSGRSFGLADSLLDTGGSSNRLLPGSKKTRAIQDACS